MIKKERIKRFNILALIIFLLLAIALKPQIAQTNNENTIYVDINGGADYIFIQEAINAAEDGDKIYVYSGNYYENIVINKSINIQGQDKTNTIIDGNDKGDVVYLSSNFINFTGFTIQKSGMKRYDEGINIDSDFNRITDNIIKDCNCGLSIDYWAHNCVISENSFARNIKGISSYSIYPNNNLIYHNNFAENKLNAYDDSNSTWSLLKKGNYWDDYEGLDENGDGIGDTPYIIPGGSTQDNYPLVEPYGTPGFEIIIMISAIILVILILKKKNKGK